MVQGRYIVIRLVIGPNRSHARSPTITCERMFVQATALRRYEKHARDMRTKAVALFTEMPDGSLLPLRQSGSIFWVQTGKLV